MRLIAPRNAVTSAQRLRSVTMQDINLLEKEHLQKLIIKNEDQFFSELEIGRKLKLIGEEVPVGSKDKRRRADLLGIDKDGNIVVFELKRGNGPHLELQALKYGLLIRSWEPSKFIQHYKEFKDLSSIEQATRELQDFVDSDILSIKTNRLSIILVAEKFEEEVKILAHELNSMGRFDVFCVRVEVFENSENLVWEFSCENKLDIEHDDENEQAADRTSASAEITAETSFAAFQNKSFLSVFRREYERKITYKPKFKRLVYRDKGVRWSISAKQYGAYLWQTGRFPDDIEHYSKFMDDPKEGDGGSGVIAKMSKPEQLERLIELIEARKSSSAQIVER